jgi:hypothetical protein
MFNWQCPDFTRVLLFVLGISETIEVPGNDSSFSGNLPDITLRIEEIFILTFHLSHLRMHVCGTPIKHAVTVYMWIICDDVRASNRIRKRI